MSNKTLKYSMVEQTAGASYVHLGYIKPRPNNRIMPWSEQGLLDYPQELSESNLSKMNLRYGREKLFLVNHGNYKQEELDEFMRDYNDRNHYSKVVGIITDDRDLHVVRCALLN